MAKITNINDENTAQLRRDLCDVIEVLEDQQLPIAAVLLQELIEPDNELETARENARRAKIAEAGKAWHKRFKKWRAPYEKQWRQETKIAFKKWRKIHPRSYPKDALIPFPLEKLTKQYELETKDLKPHF